MPDFVTNREWSVNREHLSTIRKSKTRNRATPLKKEHIHVGFFFSWHERRPRVRKYGRNPSGKSWW